MGTQNSWNILCNLPWWFLDFRIWLCTEIICCICCIRIVGSTLCGGSFTLDAVELMLWEEAAALVIVQVEIEQSGGNARTTIWLHGTYDLKCRKRHKARSSKGSNSAGGQRVGLGDNVDQQSDWIETNLSGRPPCSDDGTWDNWAYLLDNAMS